MTRVKLTSFPVFFWGGLYLIGYISMFNQLKTELPIKITYFHGIIVALLIAYIIWLVMNRTKYFYNGKMITIIKGNNEFKTEIPLSEIIEVVSKKGIFGYGNIILIHSNRKIKLKNIANVDKIADQLRKLKNNKQTV
jgi:hypothetical protein